MKKIALLTLLLINLSLSFSLPRNQASPAIFSVTQSAGTILFRHTDSTQTIIPCQSVASIVSNADPSKIVSVWVVQQGDYDKIMQFDYSVCGFSTKQEAVDSVTVWASCLYVSDSAYTTILYTNTDSATITSYDVLNSQNAPPGSPATGDTYLVGTSPSGAWVGHAKDVAEWNGSSWDFTDGVQGDFLYNATTALTYIFRSGNWVQTTGIPALHNGNNISSGLKIGTNNARSLTFETNNVNRGRFDSIGRFHVYNLPTSSTGDTFVTLVNTLGKFTKQGKGTFLSALNTSLLPNGIKTITASRDLNASDAGYVLILQASDIDTPVVLNIPYPSPLDVGDNFIVTTSNEIDNTSGYFDADAGSVTRVMLGETVFFTTTNDGVNEYSFSLSNVSLDGGDGENKSALRYLYDKSQNAIPLSGTEVDKPVTGDIYFNDATSLVLNDGGGGVSFRVGYSGANTYLNFQTGSGLDYISVNSDGAGTSRGLAGSADYSANITDLDYTQKIYVGFRGTATLSSGTVTVSTASVKTGYKIYLSVNTPSGTQGFLSAPTGSIVYATSFVINSTNAGDNSTVNWWIAP